MKMLIRTKADRPRICTWSGVSVYSIIMLCRFYIKDEFLESNHGGFIGESIIRSDVNTAEWCTPAIAIVCRTVTRHIRGRNYGTKENHAEKKKLLPIIMMSSSIFVSGPFVWRGDAGVDKTGHKTSGRKEQWTRHESTQKKVPLRYE